jgi:plasmid stabilization system protein ParE
MKRPFILHEKALKDVNDIWDYVADLAGELVADRLAAKIHDDCRMLARLPGVGHVRSDLTRRQMLFWTSGPFHIIYHPETMPLEVGRIIHTARDIKTELR